MLRNVKGHMNTGWRLGVNKSSKKKLNTKAYPDNWRGREAQFETAIQLYEQLKNGKIIPLIKGEKAIIPQFCVPKKVDPITGRITKYRLIRDCSHSGKGECSINDLTPDEAANVSMPTVMDVASYIYAMYHWYGTGCFMSKTDLKVAFRQWPLHPEDCAYCVYKFAGLKFMDMHDIWGSRSGSKHTQEIGQALGHFFMIHYNGRKKMRQLDKIMMSTNIAAWIMDEQRTEPAIVQDDSIEKTPLREWNADQICTWMNKE